MIAGCNTVVIPMRIPRDVPDRASLAGNNPPAQMPRLDPLPGSEGACENGMTNPALDILIILDDSRSMADSQTAMKEQSARLVGRLTQLGLDYHLALTTTSLDGSRRGPGALVTAGRTKVVTPGDTLGAAQAFWHLLDEVDTGGGVDEYGILTAAVALAAPTEQLTRYDEFGRSRTVSGARDPEFIRDNARTLVIIISDEDDGSTVPAHPHFLLQQRPKPEDLRVVAIVDPGAGPKQGCKKSSAWSGTPTYHDGVAALAGRGQIIDFCADFGTSVDLIALLALQQVCAAP